MRVLGFQLFFTLSDRAETILKNFKHSYSLPSCICDPIRKN